MTLTCVASDTYKLVIFSLQLQHSGHTTEYVPYILVKPISGRKVHIENVQPCAFQILHDLLPRSAAMLD